MNRFDGKTILIAGGATGIGAAAARRIAGERGNVVIGDIRFEPARILAAELTQNGGRAAAVHYDQRDESSIKNLVRDALGRFGRVDGFFGNAADIDASKPPYGIDRDIGALDAEAWLDTYKVNTVGLAIAIRELIPAMLEQGGGAIVLTTTDSAFHPFKLWSAYAASKAALGPIIRHTCLKYGKKGIRANAVSPGFIASESILKMMEKEKADGQLSPATSALMNSINCPRVGVPEDVAAATAFLLSDDAAFINGQIISINGGSYCRP